MNETIEMTSIDLSPSQPVRIKAPYWQKLKIMAAEQRKVMGAMLEGYIEQEWDRTHPQPITISEELERG
jgi:predicted DNA-binding ribbon-helix-helix protein